MLVIDCLYSRHLHSNNKAKLYYKLIKTPDKEVLDNILKMEGLYNLYSLSSIIAKAENPIEIIVSTLGKALELLDEKSVLKSTYEFSKRRSFESYTSDIVAEVLRYRGRHYIQFGLVPPEIFREGEEKFKSFYGGQEKSLILKKEIEIRDSLVEKLYSKESEFQKYINDEFWLLEKDDNLAYERKYTWVIRAFERYAHDLNTSRMLNQPLFYNNLDVVKENIKSMDDWKLLATFEDFIVPIEEIEENVEKANYFSFTTRADLTKEANDSMSRWYAKNREIYLNFMQIDPDKKDSIIQEITMEIERRGLLKKQTELN